MARLSDETLEYLPLYPWPSNIRPLANEVRRIIALAEPDTIVAPSLLSPEILSTEAHAAPCQAPALVSLLESLRADRPREESRLQRITAKVPECAEVGLRK